ncbi:MAG TPA: hypothetical protein VLK23_01030 [Thermodesulfobacteriota bacterium]|nr:hypothetical protein [Thermodesulfobacteriota bacterium]
MNVGKWIGIIMVLAILSFFFFGCASSSKETKTRCPKCASFYDTREGEEMFKYMQGR